MTSVMAQMMQATAKLKLHDWLRVDQEGQMEYIPPDKHGIVEELDIPYRDLRMVDPLVPIPYPAAIFIRDRALVINLENIRMIICNDQAFFLAVPAEGQDSRVWEAPTIDNWLVRDVKEQLQDPEPSIHGIPISRKLSYKERKDKALPFELAVLECALWGCHLQLQKEVDALDGPAGSLIPAINALTARVERKNLEAIRNVKADMESLLDRVGAVKKELEDILDDDEDMADMYLERRAEQLTAATASRAANQASAESRSDVAAPRSPVTLAARRDEPRVSPHDIEEAENLLESYFLQMNLLLSRLLLVKSRIEDTEDLINIELDHRRNQLVAFNLLVTILSACFGFVAMVGGIFGMNLAPMPVESTVAGFYAATFGGLFAASILLVSLVFYARSNGLLFIPEASL
eukprot:jgi/Botrbrau1/4183/Bobra.0192s0043.1